MRKLATILAGFTVAALLLGAGPAHTNGKDWERTHYAPYTHVV